MFARQAGHVRARKMFTRPLLFVVLLALLAGMIGPAVNYAIPGRDDDATLLAEAMAKSPKQRGGTAAAQQDEAGGAPNSAGPKSLQSKYAPIAAGVEKAAANRVKVETPPSRATGYDEKTSKELPERRTPTERTYANTDGTHTTEFSQDPINYRTPSGEYQPIDTTVVPKENGAGWRNAGDSIGVGFAAAGSPDSLVDLKLDEEHGFGFGVADAAGTAGQVSGSSVSYRGVRESADIRFDVVPGGLKETLVLDSPQAPTAWEFPLRLNGLRPSLVDGRVALLDTAGQERARIPAGFMTDAARDPETGEAALSRGVTYRLVERAGKTVLRVELDAAWLRDPARKYPVEVDPSVDTTASNGGTVFQNGSRLDGSTELKAGTTGPLRAASYLSFGGVETRLRNHKILGAQLTLKNTWSWSCQPRPLTVHGVTAPWNTASGYPGPGYGPALADPSFARGYIGRQQHASSCPSTTELIPLGPAGRDLVQRWVTGESSNYGLTIRASETDPYGWKKFTGHNTANPPRLFVTHSAYDAGYRVDRGVPEPPVTRTQGGKVRITVTNRSAETWRAADYALGYRGFTAAGAPVVAKEAASLPRDVPRGESVTLDATIGAIEPGDYLFDFSMLRRGGPWFTDEQVPPTRLSMTVFDIPPIVKAQYPPNGYSAQTLTPQLWVDAVDVDAPVSSALKYRFEVCEDYRKQPDGTLTGVSCVDSGYVGKRTWNVPPGALRWSKDYQWRAFAYDGHSESEKLAPSHLLTAVPQPEITSHLANAPYSGAQRDFDPQTGNYFSSAVDAALQVTGPELNITRTYNSLDPRRDLLFGSGWSTRYDMKVVPDDDGSGNVVVTYPDGQQVRFGRNHDGSFAAPPGRQANFRVEVEANGGGWVLTDKASTLYRFRPDGRLIAVYDQAGHYIELDYGTPEHLKRIISRTSDRILYFTWTGNHVTSVATDPIDGKQLTWTYSYDGDKLTKVCDPNNGCTGYDHVAGSHYRSSVVDSRPSSYWRFGETNGAVAASQNGLKLGKDNGTYKDVVLGQPGPLKDGADTAASFNGTSSVVTVPDGLVRKNRDLAIEMWFKTSQGGPLFGYQRAPIGSTPTGAVPVLYVGTDGKLRGQFWNGGVGPITSAEAVNNDQWHHVVLSGSLATQTLYLDGRKVGSAQGEISHDDIVYNQIGAAYTVPPSAWPAWGTEPRRFFSGQIDEVAFYEYPVGPTTAQAHFQAGSGADYLSKITLPSGRVAAQLSYNTAADRLAEVTDRDDGHWKLGVPVVTGTEGNLIRTTQISDPGNRPHFYDYDPMRGRILRYVAPLGLGLRPEDRRDNTGAPAPPEPPCDPSAPPKPGEPSYCGGPVNGGGPWTGGPVTGLGVRTYDYDDKGFQTTVGDELGNVLVFTNDERGNVVARKSCRVSPGDCQTSYYSYYLNSADVTDPRNDKLLSAKDARSSGPGDAKYATTYTYTDLGVRGLVQTKTTPDGATTRYRYTESSDAAVGGGNTPAGLIALITDPRGGETRYSYFRNGDLAQVVDPAGLTTTYTYDVFGRQLAETTKSDSNPGGLTTTYGYDALSHQVSVTSPGVVNPLDNITHTAQTVSAYDPDGNLLRTEAKDLTGGDAARITAYAYDNFGRRSQETDAEGGNTFYGYDPFGNKTWMVDPGGNKYEYGYTARNALAEVRLRAWHGQATDPSTGAGDQDGEGDTSALPTLVLDSYGYDLAGRRIRHTDSMGRTTKYQYFDDGKLWRTIARDVRDPDNPNAAKRDIKLEELTYDAAGNVVKRLAPGGLLTTYEYDATGRGTAQTADPAGLANRVEWTYAPAGDVTRAQHTGASSNSTRVDVGRVETVEYGYDVAGRQTSTSVMNGSSGKLTTSYTYDQRGLVTSVTAPRGNVEGADPAQFTTNFEYDRSGLASSVVFPPAAAESAGGQAVQTRARETTGYNAFGEPTGARDANGNVSSTTYDRVGRVVEQASPDYRKPGESAAAKSITKVRYDAQGNVLSKTDPMGATTRFRYDQLNRPVERVDPKPDAGDLPGGVWSYTYTTAGEQLSEMDPTGARTEATYDDLGRQLTATKLERRPEPAAYTTQLRYDDAGNVVSTTSPTGEATKHAYDVLGRRVSTTDPAGVITQQGYDLSGNQVRASDGLGRTTYLTFDAAGRNVGAYWYAPDEHLLRKTSAGYDQDGNRISVTDALLRTTKFAYDNRGRLVQQQEPVSDKETITTSFGYDAAGNRTRSTDGRGNATIQTYNALGLPESVVEPATAAHPNSADRTWTASYDLNGQALTLQAPGGVTRQRTVDALGRLTAETGSGAAEPTTERKRRFDAAGRLVGVNTPTGEEIFTYNDRGDLLTSTGPVAGTSTYGYDAAGRLTQRVDGAGTATFSYAQGRLSTQQDGLTGVKQTVGYDGAGALASVDYGSGRTRTYSYDDLGRQTGDVVKGSDGASLASMTYGYDANDRLTSKKTTGFAGAGDNAYGYDYAGRLTSWTAGGQTVDYGWDASGNRVKAGDKTATFDERNRQLTDGADTLRWSPRGTLESRGGVAFGFDAFDRSVKQGGASYSYDGLDRTSGRDDKTFSYDGLSLNLTSDGTSSFSRSAGDDLLAQRPGGGAGQLALTDRHSDVVGGLDPSASALTGSASFDPFGTKTGSAGATSALGFQSDYTDPDTGSVDMGARWYAPGTGTFSARDDVSLPADPSVASNRYTFGNASPTNYTDPDGHCPICVVIIIHLGVEVAVDLIFEGTANAPTYHGSPGDYRTDGWGKSDRGWNPSYRSSYSDSGTGAGPAPGRRGGHSVGPRGRHGHGVAAPHGRRGHGGGSAWRPAPPPPPPPGIKARQDAWERALRVADAIPADAQKNYLVDGTTSSNPNLPASRVSGTAEGLQNAAELYRIFRDIVRGPNGEVVQNVDPLPMSELAQHGDVEVFFRAMSRKEFESFKVNGIVPKRTESFVTQEADYIKTRIPRFKRGEYDVVVTMFMKPGTRDMLVEHGAISRPPAPLLEERGLGHLPTLQPGNANQVHVKAERGYVTYGLRLRDGSGTSQLYNERIIGYRDDELKDFAG
ncbi:LamG-like jellyroll fold domain-containing protein [Amycolatopsis sp. cg13]|uniref:LamG-like jellyroll fold domain-containing protein n=1 Tax=Amycolatopsis sp. cg13 TaxID=3238807 RepID=UPI003526B71E